jgi:hypothetical protein
MSKIEEKDDHLIKEESHIVVDALDAMTLIGKKEYFELIPYLYDFLQDPDEYLRAKVILTFGEFHAEQLPGLEDKLLKIWSNEEEEMDVRLAALNVWAGFHRCSYNKNLIIKMYLILKTKKNDACLRFTALNVMCKIMGERLPDEGLDVFYKICKLSSKGDYTEDEFNNFIDWEKINSYIEKHAPEALQND